MRDKTQEKSSAPEEYSISSADLSDLMQEVLGKDGLFQFKARGSSMTPFIRDGDVITIAPFEKGKVGLGSIVAFKHPNCGHLVIHRIIKMSSIAVLTGGDNNPQNPDGWIQLNYLIGRVIEVLRNGRCTWLGLGIERYLIAYLSRLKWLLPLRRAVAVLRGRK